jgi:hypothetical protein
MKINIVNCPDVNFKPYVEEAVAFYSKELIPDGRLRNRCKVKIRFTNKIDEYGFASVEGFNSRNEPREFLVEVHPGIGVRAILETLAHEMVHVKQYIRGETNDQLSVWRGRRINSDKVDYWEHPWEIDAFGREAGLFYKFVTTNHLWDIFPDFRNPALPITPIPITWK